LIRATCGNSFRSLIISGWRCASCTNTHYSPLPRLRVNLHTGVLQVLVTVNIILKQDELEPLIELLAVLDAVEVDAIIVQDQAVGAIARAHFPNLRLHASTQMAIHNQAGVAKAASLGFKRVVLARELTSKEMQDIRCVRTRGEPSGARLLTCLDVFRRSGEPYRLRRCSWRPSATARCATRTAGCASSRAPRTPAAGTGANAPTPAESKGFMLMTMMVVRCTAMPPECAQRAMPAVPNFWCGSRRPYNILNEEGYGFLFSMKDLDTSEDLSLLADAGIHTLKIEGRMKDAHYVSSTVRVSLRFLLAW
jgi:hypothetical protein